MACRVVLTDHEAFVLINIYGPNAGGRSDGPRYDLKLRFFQALHAKCASLRAAGREVTWRNPDR